jgi:hypothetical protein
MFEKTILCLVLIWFLWSLVCQSFNGSDHKGSGHPPS